mgnify:CR=1 FL=1
MLLLPVVLFDYLIIVHQLFSEKDKKVLDIPLTLLYTVYVDSDKG